MIKATGDIMIVEVQYRPKTTGGIILPSSITAEPQSFGKVVSVGADVKDENIKEGTMLVFHPRAGQDMVLKNTIYKAVRYNEVYGLVEDPEITDGLFTMTISRNEDNSPIIKPVKGLIQGV